MMRLLILLGRNSSTPTFLVVALITFLIGANSATAKEASSRIKVYSLEHRSGKDLIPILQPFFQDGAVLQVDGNQLILRGTAHHHDDLQQLLKSLDSPKTALQISIRYEGLGTSISSSNQLLKEESANEEKRRAHQNFTTKQTGMTIVTLAGESIYVHDEEIRSYFRVRGGRRPAAEQLPASASTTHHIVADLLAEDKVTVSLRSVREQFASQQKPLEKNRQAIAVKQIGRLDEWIDMIAPGDRSSKDRNYSTKGREVLRVKVSLVK